MSSNKVVVVTGANKGIGFAVVKQILQQNPSWTVYLTARDKERGENAVKQLKDEHGLTAQFHLLDIDSLDSIRAFRDVLKNKHNRLDILINNAAILPLLQVTDSTPDEFRKMAEATIQTDYFGTLNVCNELFPLLAPGARVVIVSSRTSPGAFGATTEPMQQKIRACSTVDQVGGILRSLMAADWSKLDQTGWTTQPLSWDGWFGYKLGSFYAYGMAKLGLNLLTQIFQKQFDSAGKNVVINACCPGEVKTDMNPVNGKKTPDEGADTIVYAALLPPETPHRGQFLGERNVLDPFVFK